MKNYTLSALIWFLLLAPLLFAQTAVTTIAPIPEEARKHFVMGETMFKEAKSPETFSQAAGEFKEAARLAPQWPEARYNLALAKEAAGDYSSAMADLKIYQQFKLSESEARTVQDKIYALEAKAGLAAKKQAAAQDGATQVAAHQEMLRFFQGEWNFTSFNPAIASSGFGSGHGKGTSHITIAGNEIVIKLGRSSLTSLKGTITGDDLSSIKWFVHDEEDKASDCPITVTIDKTGSRIYWKEPLMNPATASGWANIADKEVNLTR